ncbi:MAG: hypothetical protein ACWGQW_06840 [bacterium]
MRQAFPTAIDYYDSSDTYHYFNRSWSIPLRASNRYPTFTYLYFMLEVRFLLYAYPTSPDVVVISRAAYTLIAVASSRRLEVSFH